MQDPIDEPRQTSTTRETSAALTSAVPGTEALPGPTELDEEEEQLPRSRALRLASAILKVWGWTGILGLIALLPVTLSGAIPLLERLRENPALVFSLLSPFGILSAARDLRRGRRRGAVLALIFLLLDPLKSISLRGGLEGWSLMFNILIAALVVSVWEELN